MKGIRKWGAICAGLLVFLNASAQAGQQGVAAKDDSYLWVSGGLLSAFAESSGIGSGIFGSVVGGFDGNIFGFYHAGMSVTSKLFDFGCASANAETCNENHDTAIQENALVMGRLFARRRMWWGAGVARVEEDGARCQHVSNNHTCVTTGLSGVIAAEVPNGPLGMEFRLNGNINSLDNYIAIGIGLRFGSNLRLTSSPAVAGRPGHW